MIAWTIYDHPIDFPHTYVARKFELRDPPVPTGDFIVSPNLDALRGQLAGMGLMWFPRDEGDVPHIIETWL